MNIDVHIERLILDGVDIPRHQRTLLQTALVAELTRLLAQDGVGPAILQGGALSKVPSGQIMLTGDGDAAALGGQIARAVYGGIGNE